MRYCKFNWHLILIPLLFAQPVFAQKKTEVNYQLYFTNDHWKDCEQLFADQMIAAQSEGSPLALYWYDFSPRERITVNGNLVEGARDHSIEGTVDTLMISSLDPVAWRQYGRDPNDEWGTFRTASEERYKVYEHLLGYLWLTRKAPGLVKGLKTAEKMLELERSDIGVVEMDVPTASGRMERELIGAIRIYDATASHYKSSPLSPPELMYQARGMKSEGIDKLRADHPDADFYAIGNWMLPHETLSGVKVPPRARLRAKLMLLKLLRDKIVRRSTNAWYIVHVASKKLKRSYGIDFGFTEIQSDPIEGSTDRESLMVANEATLGAKLDARIDELTRLLGTGGVQ